MTTKQCELEETAERGRRTLTVECRLGGTRTKASAFAKSVRILFWAELVCALSVNLCGFSLPVVGQLAHVPPDRIHRLFQISQLIRPFSMFFVVYAVIRLTAPTGGFRRATGGQVALRILVMLELILQWMLTARRHGVSFPTPLVFWVARHILYASLAVGVFVFLASVLRTFFDLKRARSAVFVGVAVSVSAIFTRFGVDPLLAWFDITETLTDWVVLLLNGVAGAWAFVVLWDIQKSFQRVAESRCVGCGYSLRGLREPRCPECGTEFGDTDVKDEENRETPVLRATDGQSRAIE